MLSLYHNQQTRVLNLYAQLNLTFQTAVNEALPSQVKISRWENSLRISRNGNSSKRISISHNSVTERLHSPAGPRQHDDSVCGHDVAAFKSLHHLLQVPNRSLLTTQPAHDMVNLHAFVLLTGSTTLKLRRRSSTSQREEHVVMTTGRSIPWANYLVCKCVTLTEQCCWPQQQLSLFVDVHRSEHAGNRLHSTRECNNHALHSHNKGGA